MNCAETRTLMDGYLDQELDVASVMALERHIASCGECKDIYAQQAALRAALRQHASYHTAPAALAERIRARIRETPGGAPVKADKPRWAWPQFGRWLQLGTAVAATAAVTWMAAFQINAPDLVAEQVIAGHARSMLTSHLTDVETSDRHTVKPWLSSKLDFSPAVTDLTTAGFPLVGGRLDYLDNRPVAALVYRRRQHVINLFIWPDAATGKAFAMRNLSRHGYHLLHWSDAGMNYWAISDLDATELRTFAETYASAK